jgi:hypothetical protein
MAKVTDRDLLAILAIALRGVRVPPAAYAGLVSPTVTRVLELDRIVELSNGQMFRLALEPVKATQEVENARAL